jgi:hypothetical protein
MLAVPEKVAKRTAKPRAAKPTRKQVAQANRLMLGMTGR